MEEVISVTDEEIAQHNATTEDAFKPGTFAWYIPAGEIRSSDIQLVCITALAPDGKDFAYCVPTNGSPRMDLPWKRLKGNVMYRASGNHTFDLQRAV
jgi:hypothetical protein